MNDSPCDFAVYVDSIGFGAFIRRGSGYQDACVNDSTASDHPLGSGHVLHESITFQLVCVIFHV